MTRATAAAVADPAPLLTRAREELWRAVSARDEYAAGQVVFSALDAGAGAENVLLDVIAPVQGRVGAEWAADRFTVAQEHAATAIHDRIIAAMAHRTPAAAAPGTSGTVTVACVDGEWHALPARILAEVLRLRGHRVDFLGAQVPTPHLVAHLHQTAPTALALSSSVATRLPAAHAATTAAQATGVPVLAGGAAFGPDGRYARLLGADGWAPDARSAALLLAAGLTRPGTGAVRQALEDLPHLADQEYTMVARGKRRLVRNTLAGLDARIPAMRAYTDAQRERTAEDVAHIVDFLATALYVDDPPLFTGFLAWTAGILRARGVPAGVLTPCLTLLSEDLRDFPRALTLLTEGRTTLDTMPPPHPAPAPRAAAATPDPLDGSRDEAAAPIPLAGARGDAPAPVPLAGSQGAVAAPAQLPGSRDGVALPRPLPGSREDAAASGPLPAVRDGGVLPRDEAPPPRPDSAPQGDPSSSPPRPGSARQGDVPPPRPLPAPQVDPPSPRPDSTPQGDPPSPPPRPDSAPQGDVPAPRPLPGPRGDV